MNEPLRLQDGARDILYDIAIKDPTNPRYAKLAVATVLGTVPSEGLEAQLTPVSKPEQDSVRKKFSDHFTTLGFIDIHVEYK